MHLKNYALACVILFAGCASGPGTAETEREIVLQYVGVDVGTAGPFTKKSSRELDILADKDRSAAAALLNRGAVGFLVYAKTPNVGNTTATNSPPNKQLGPRVILLQHGRVVGDYKAP